MTPSDLITTLLVAGLNHVRDGADDDLEFKIGDEHFHADLNYKSIWRYPDVRPFDIGAIVLKDGCVLVLHEGKEPNHGRWEHYHVFTTPAEAWGFIRSFLQEHP